MKNFWRSTIGKVLLTIVLVILPVIPVLSSPAVPDPSYELTVISLLHVFLLFWLVGVWYSLQWYSYIAFLAVIAVLVLVWRGGRR